jgi:hypothetical protein
MKGLEDEIKHRTMTYTFWNQSKRKLDMQGWHPVTFKHSDVDGKFMEKIKVK